MKQRSRKKRENMEKSIDKSEIVFEKDTDDFINKIGQEFHGKMWKISKETCAVCKE